MTSNQVVRPTLSWKKTLPSIFDIFYAIEVSVAGLLYSALIHLPAQVLPALFLIVHHFGSFRPTQHKVVYILLLKVVCGRPILLLFQIKSDKSVRSTSTHYNWNLESLPSFIQHPFPFVHLGLVQDTHVFVYG